MTESSIDQYPVNDGVLRLAICGEVDLANSDLLTRAISTAIKRWSVAEVVVDLDRVTFLDSTGISVLMAGHNLAADYGVAYFVVNPCSIRLASSVGRDGCPGPWRPGHPQSVLPLG
jgi:stage II sporulation protein AA (anti-sigma F factor antagonist)